VTRPSLRTLTTAELNRATLARQGLLERLDLDPVAAIERFGGLQAQEPASPYLALWTRLADFDPATLDRAFRERRVVKATLMRSTLHAVSAEDYRHLLPAVLPMLRSIRRQDRLQPPDAARMARLIDAALAFTAEPRTLSDVRDHVANHASPEIGHAPDELVWWLRRHATFVHAPSDAPWSFGRRPLIASATVWLEDPDFAADADALGHLARRYLGAFGPASVADLAAWSGLPVGRVRPAIESLAAADELDRFVDERGRDLVDLVDAPLPPADTPAPARLLPMWDSVLLAFADRKRVISDEDRAVVVARNGDVLPSFLVDGRVAGLWWAESVEGRTRIALEPFRPLDPGDRAALEVEGERLAALVESVEPTVYARYRRTRARRPVRT
jgi:hypothetical protein